MYRERPKVKKLQVVENPPSPLNHPNHQKRLVAPKCPVQRVAAHKSQVPRVLQKAHRAVKQVHQKVHIAPRLIKKTL